MRIKCAALLLGLTSQAAKTAVGTDGWNVAPTESFHRRALMERAEHAARNWKKFKREYFKGANETETELTDADVDRLINEAIAKAQANSPRFGEEGFQWTLMRPIKGLEEYYDPNERERVLSHTLTTTANVHLVSGQSPGWSWNFGRNEYYCVSVDIYGWQYYPTVGSDLKLLECTNVYPRQYAFRYSRDDEMRFYGFDDPFWDWCAETSEPGNGTVRINKCNTTDERQQFSILGGNADNSWRPKINDAIACITANPPESGARGHKGKIPGTAVQPPGGVLPGTRRLKRKKKKKTKKRKKRVRKKKKKKKNRSKSRHSRSKRGSKGSLRIEECSIEGEKRLAQTFLICQETTQCVWNLDIPTCFPTNANCI